MSPPRSTLPTLQGPMAKALEAFAEDRGWGRQMQLEVSRAVAVLLADRCDGPVPESSIAVLAERRPRLPVRHTREFLASLDLATPAPYASTVVWVDEHLQRLAPRISSEVRAWVEVILGAGRAPAKHHDTLRTYLWVLQGPLESFSNRYSSLREVTRDDVTSELARLEGSKRAMTATALRSLFRTLKAKHLVFANPTARLRPGRGPERAVLGVDPTVLSQLLQLVKRPDHRLIVLLAGVHALTRHQIRHILLEDVDLSRLALLVDGRRRPLDSLTAETLQDWLMIRGERWPQTANPYLLINRHTAFGLGPVNPSVVTFMFRELPTTAGALRNDRLLAEARSCGGDPLHLARAFGLSYRTAMRFALAADEPSHAEGSR
jgi:hypothetical protein